MSESDAGHRPEVDDGPDSLADDLAAAWLMGLAVAEPTVFDDFCPYCGYKPDLPDGWTTSVWRRLTGYATGRVRPQHWPWKDSAFDDLPWLYEQREGFRVVRRQVEATP